MAKETSKMTELVGVRLSAELFEAIEQWRREQPKIPTRPDAIRDLVEEGLASYRRKKTDKKRG